MRTLSAPLRLPRVAFPSCAASVAQALLQPTALPASTGLRGAGKGGGATGIDSPFFANAGAPTRTPPPPRTPPLSLPIPTKCFRVWSVGVEGGKNTHKAQHLSLSIYINIYILAQCLFSGTLVWQSMHLVRKRAIHLLTWSVLFFFPNVRVGKT